jgi:secreted Zn-dependent insulinase-like peptidase
MKNKISESQLEKLQEFNQFMINASASLGNIQFQYEFTKSQLVNEIAQKQESFNEFKKELEEEFGNVEINVTTGEIIVPKVEEK